MNTGREYVCAVVKMGREAVRSPWLAQAKRSVRDDRATHYHIAQRHPDHHGDSYSFLSLDGTCTTMDESTDDVAPADPELLRRLDAIIGILFVVMAILVLDFAREEPTAVGVVALVALALGLFYLAAVSSDSEE